MKKRQPNQQLTGTLSCSYSSLDAGDTGGEGTGPLSTGMIFVSDDQTNLQDIMQKHSYNTRCVDKTFRTKRFSNLFSR